MGRAQRMPEVRNSASPASFIIEHSGRRRIAFSLRPKNLFLWTALSGCQRGINGASRTIEAVSYTHLDVYKRQVLGGAPAGQHNGIGSSAQLHITTENGSLAANILIGGYDNDVIEGGGGNDLLMGGNLNFLIDPNMLTISNDGRDELIGGTGADNITFEADGGIVEGGATQNVDDDDIDTMWATAKSLGQVTAANADDLITDGVLRFDLAVGKEGGLNNYSGYGGADQNAANGNYTADQTNYINPALRVQVQDMENAVSYTHLDVYKRQG